MVHSVNPLCPRNGRSLEMDGAVESTLPRLVGLAQSEQLSAPSVPSASQCGKDESLSRTCSN
jgi:hypothetical protein